MAIATAAAIGLGLAAAGTVASTVSSNNASRRAVNAQTQNTATNNALQANIYGQNKEALAPYVQSGVQAQTQLNSLLGLGGQQAQMGAFDTFRNSAGYQFQRDEGLNALDASAAARGSLRSGASQMSAQRYGTNLANNYLGQFTGLLGNQQAVGLGAASAQAGVSQNYANNVSANNQIGADAISNGALLRGSNNSQMFATLGGLAGNALTRYGSSYR